MENNTFIGGVSPGGLTSSTEIKIFICYLLSSCGGTLQRAQIDKVVSSKGIANYFEYSDALERLCENGHIEMHDTADGEAWSITDSGREIADRLERDLPYSVREKAYKTAVQLMDYEKKRRQNRVEIERLDSGFNVVCKMDADGGELMSVSLFVPSEEQAKLVRDNFVNSGDVIYAYMLALLTNEFKDANNIIASLNIDGK